MIFISGSCPEFNIIKLNIIFNLKLIFVLLTSLIKYYAYRFILFNSATLFRKVSFKHLALRTIPEKEQKICCFLFMIQILEDDIYCLFTWVFYFHTHVIFNLICKNSVFNYYKMSAPHWWLIKYICFI